MHRMIKWSPYWDMEEMARGQSQAPAMDVYEKDNNIVVEIPVAGFDEKNVDLSIEDNILTIKGTTEKKSEIDDKEYYRQEVQYGAFQNSFAFPVEVDGDKASASYKKGILTISVPKKQKQEPKKKSIKVQLED
ncbi:Hsp20/alpha crystallin family protein [Patescibacteria group bacterium]|nr:Hsp20/alpha crystallin family protein [Patescibacteria group bacterium]MBU1963928.1 Hsp20/alpha crystallin family protein [Patescibacteria group bacterium]